MKRIRSWLATAETCRRHYVDVETVEKKTEKRDERQAADVRHGVLPMAGRRVA